MPSRALTRGGYARRWLPLAARASGYAVRSAYNSFKSRSANSTNQSRRQLQSAPAPITGFEDARTTYTYKRMPRRKKRAWRKFVKRSRAVTLGLSAPNFLVITRQYNLTSTANKQGYTDIHTVLGCAGSTTCSDIQQLASRVQAVTGAANIDQKFAITGWLAETQVINTSATPVYLDLYYWRCHKAVPNFVAGLPGSVNRLYQQGLVDLAGNAPVGGSTLDGNDYGVTPYQCPLFSGHLKIYRKTRVKLSANGGLTQIETRSGKNYFRNFDVDVNLAMDENTTQGIFMIVYGAPSSMNPTAEATNLYLSTNINYTYKIIQRNIITGGTTAA
ncbi:capsid protein [Capybara virus 2_cap1_255]|nr:capsid protein [Capybara virus 2_cap1_255]